METSKHTSEEHTWGVCHQFSLSFCLLGIDLHSYTPQHLCLMAFVCFLQGLAQLCQSQLVHYSTMGQLFPSTYQD